jgi:hypothetical protein
MDQATLADGVLFSDAHGPRPLKPTDHRFKVAFKVVPDHQALRYLRRPDAPAGQRQDGAPYHPDVIGGLGVHGDLRSLRGRHLHCGDFVELELRHSDPPACVHCLGTVAWVRIDHNARVFHAGVGFVGVDMRDLEGAG